MKQPLITSQDVKRANTRIAAQRSLTWEELQAQPIRVECHDPIAHTKQAPYCGDPECPCAEDEREEDRRDMEHDYWASV